MFGKEEFGFCSGAPWFFAPLVVVCTDTGRYWPDIQRNVTGKYLQYTSTYVRNPPTDYRPLIIIMVEVMRETMDKTEDTITTLLTAGNSRENKNN